MSGPNLNKTCTNCGVRKPASGFHRKAANPDGLRHTCRECVAGKGRHYREAFPDIVAASKKGWVRRNPEKVAAIAARAKDGEKTRASYMRPTHPEAYAKLVVKWAKRRADRVRATPSWYDADKVRSIYLQAGRMRNAGFDVHVDHILPLRGDTVCGLHVHNNLRIIPATENLSKGAKVLPIA